MTPQRTYELCWRGGDRDLASVLLAVLERAGLRRGGLGEKRDPGWTRLQVDVESGHGVEALRRELLRHGSDHAGDVSFRSEPRRPVGAVVFDGDGTLLQGEVIDELARHAGVGPAVAGITRRAMEGELDFAASLRERVALLRGLGEDALQNVWNDLQLASGAAETLRELRDRGVRTAMVTGGFSWFAQRLQRRLDLDQVHANRLEIDSGALTGQVLGEIVDAEAKARLLSAMAGQWGLDPAAVAAVGDGANDVPMMEAAGLGVAFQPKAAARDAADAVIAGVT